MIVIQRLLYINISNAKHKKNNKIGEELLPIVWDLEECGVSACQKTEKKQIELFLTDKN